MKTILFWTIEVIALIGFGIIIAAMAEIGFDLYSNNNENFMYCFLVVAYMTIDLIKWICDIVVKVVTHKDSDKKVVDESK